MSCCSLFVAIVIPANDSCHPDNHAVIDNVRRRFDNAPGAEDDLLCDRGLSGWFRLELDGEAAEIPHQCVKVWQENTGKNSTFDCKTLDV